MDYLTASEISTRLRVDITTVRRWLAAGDLPSIRVGRQYRVEHSAYDRFVAEREVIRTEKKTKASGAALAR
jgi:excisionase family DNA binding protein